MSEMLLADPPDAALDIDPPDMTGPAWDGPDLISETLERGLARARLRHAPAVTYRLQFNKHFTFADAAQITPYLAALGVTHAYASPYLRAPPGSEHGYDIIDHQSLNPEVGSPEDFAAWVAALRAHGMGHILDFVPNHMGVATDGNAWWQDVLENGPSSTYAAFFDIDWLPLKSDLANKVLLPVLGDQFGAVLEKHELTLEFDRGAFVLRYYARHFPITPSSYARILGERVEDLAANLGEQSPPVLEYQSILTAIKNLPSHEVTEPERRHEREREKEVIKRRLQKLCEEAPEVAQFIGLNVERLNGVRGEPRSFDALEELLREQPYRLAFWRVASDEINYRRFFDVNELAAVCMEQPEVFAKSHALVLRLIDEGQLDGLRIDHADGLYDPAGYLQQLQIERLVQLCREEYLTIASPPRPPESASRTSAAAKTSDKDSGGLENADDSEGLWSSDIEPAIRKLLARDPAASAEFQPLYVVAEKILERNERLPADWAVAGTTGYDFVNDVNGLFVSAENERPLDALYRRFSGQDRSLDELAYNAKRLIMKVAMSSELSVLGHQLDRISECNRLSCDHTLNGLTHALREVVASFPVYRTYTAGDAVVERDRSYIEQAVARAKRHNPAVSHAVFDYVKDVLLLRDLDGASLLERHLRRSFVRRFQQFTGPVMAKSFEDTVFYRYNRLVSLNEVGGDPKRFGVSVATFHQQNQERQSRQPHAMLATSTHDTKRSEDVRARINVLSEIPAEWKERVLRWARWNKRKKTKADGEPAPSRNDEYLLYQTLLGTWPVNQPPGGEYGDRICRYMVKAIREGKIHSSWISPNEDYERAVCDFVAAILSGEPASAFRVDFEPFVERVARAGWWNSLAQTLLKVASPGVPDVYPGTETWSLTLVDPDNRQPVDFGDLSRKLEEIQTRLAIPFDRAPWIKELLDSAGDGRIKLFVLSEALRLRRTHPVLFTLGQYVHLEVVGPQSQHVVAFARIHGAEAVIAAVPRLVTTLTGELGSAGPYGDLWGGTLLELPELLRGRTWRHLYTGVETSIGDQLAVSTLLSDFPVGLLVAE